MFLPQKVTTLHGDLLTWAHLSPNPKQHLEQFNCYCTAHGIVLLYFTTGRPPPLKLPLPTGGTGAHLTHDSLSPSKPKTQTVSWSGQPFLYRWPIPYNGTPLSPSNCPFPWGIWTPSNTGFLGPPESSTQTEYRSVQLLLQGSLLWQTDRQTDRPHYSVGNNRPHLHTYYCNVT